MICNKLIAIFGRATILKMGEKPQKLLQAFDPQIMYAKGDYVLKEIVATLLMVVWL